MREIKIPSKDEDSSDTAETEYTIVLAPRAHGRKPTPDNLVKLFANLPYQGRNDFACTKCGALVTVSDRKAKKLRKMKKPNVKCKTCKKAQKARHRVGR